MKLKYEYNKTKQNHLSYLIYVNVFLIACQYFMQIWL